MSVVVAIEEAGPCAKRLKIAVPAPAVEAEFARVAAEFGRRARVPGFRQGKVPADLVKRRFREDIEQEVMDHLLPRYWRQAQAETKIDPLLPPRVEEVDLRAGHPLTFTATVEIRPEVELRNVEDFDLPEMGVEPTPDEIEQALEDLRRSYATWPVATRSAGRGDRVQGQLLELSGDAQPQPVEFEIGDAGIWEELSVAASGLTAGQSAQFTRRVGEGESATEREYKLAVIELRERELPPLDDALAQRAGKFSDLPALQAEIKARIATGKRGERHRRREQAALDQLRERHPLPLPPGVVEREQEQLLREYAEGLALRGIDPEKAGVDWQKLADQVKTTAERRVHARLLLDAIGEAQAVAVTEEEFEHTLAAIARAEGRTTGALRQALDAADRLGPLRAQLRREKVLRRLIGEVQE